MRMPIAALVGLALLAGCAQPAMQPAGPPVTMPASLAQSVTDPGSSAIGFTASVFGNPASVAGRPAVVADAIAQLEWLTVNLATDQRWTGMSPNVATAMRAGRDEVRAAFGVPADAPPNAAIGAFDGARAALDAGNRAGALTALGAVTGPGGAERALGLLSALPRLPQAASGTQAAVNGLAQMQNQEMRRR